MSLLLLLSIGCTNLSAPGWAGGGARYASGYASESVDTAGDDTAGGDGNAPELVSGSAEYLENDVGQLYIVAGIAYEDDPDDVSGGRLYYELIGDGESLEEGSRTCTDDSDADANESAIIANGNLTFLVGPVDSGATHSLIVYVNDYTRNSSNEITVEVTGS